MELKRGSHSSGPGPRWWVHWGGKGVVMVQPNPAESFGAGVSMLKQIRGITETSFCKAHFYDLVQPALEHYFHHIDRKVHGLGLRFFNSFHPRTSPWHPNPRRCISLLACARPYLGKSQVVVQGMSLGARKTRVSDSPPPPLRFRFLICNMET